MTFRELINEVLIRLREETISIDWDGNINDSTLVSDYHKVIGSLVNDSKRHAESTHDWITLRDTYILTTANGTMQYALGNETSGAGINFKVLDVINQETGRHLTQASNAWLNARAFPVDKVATGEPMHYGFNGSTARSGGRPNDMNVDLYPVPTDTQSINFNIVKPQDQLRKADDILSVPTQPVILGAWARAISERGEDGGTQSNLAAAEATQSLREAIMLDSGNTEFETDWYIG